MFTSKSTRLRLKEPVKIKCKRCNYEWWTRSVNRYVLCPRCHHPNKNPAWNEYLKAVLETQRSP